MPQNWRQFQHLLSGRLFLAWWSILLHSLSCRVFLHIHHHCYYHPMSRWDLLLGCIGSLPNVPCWTFLCSSGPGTRAMLCRDLFTARRLRMHCLPSRFLLWASWIHCHTSAGVSCWIMVSERIIHLPALTPRLCFAYRSHTRCTS